MQVRDHALQIQDDMPKQGANRDFYVQNQERELALTDGTTPGGALAKITDACRSCLMFAQNDVEFFFHCNYIF